MKVVTVMICLIGVFSHLMGQISIDSYPLSVCCDKTSNIVFSYPIISVDRGSADLLAQKARGVENVLQVKAAKVDFHSTNLTVITGDGKLFSFVINYSADPSPLNISLACVKRDSAAGILLTAEKINQFILDNDETTVLHLSRFLRIHGGFGRLQAALQAIYAKDQLLWFVFELKNNSPLDWRTGFLRFFLQDKNKAKRTAVQAEELRFLNPGVVPGKVSAGCSTRFALAFEPFAVGKSKRMVIEMGDRTGGSPLRLVIKPRIVFKVKTIK